MLAHVIWHQVLPDSIGDYQHLLQYGGTQELLLAAPCRRPPHPVYRTTWRQRHVMQAGFQVIITLQVVHHSSPRQQGCWTGGLPMLTAHSACRCIKPNQRNYLGWPLPF